VVRVVAEVAVRNDQGDGAQPLEAADLAGYGRFPEQIERDWLGRWCHLSEADVSLARRRTGDVTRLGFAGGS